ncbi:MAG: MerR family transcriptional regulator [Desulfurivibrionaceae bacterium]|jgi:MerR family transcriptional regulator/heat shock protein HspR|nr:MerR family transcriptional regulator [Desulfobulbaceae bacterium]MDP2001660.1 MerR family transcriptional regulator [Desulfurivibrionaceae bacterium]MDP2757810.1 MerR family transcriptional regulator [Desulfurivibrionaceae bacterium]
MNAQCQPPEASAAGFYPKPLLADDQAVFTISAAAEMLAVTPRTLRMYERDGLLIPVRHGKWRYYSLDNLKWVSCLRSMIHEHGISLAAIHKLLQYTPCWNIAGCPFEKRKLCTAFMSSGLVPKKIARLGGLPGDQSMSA